MNITSAQIKMLQALRHQHRLPEDTYRAMLHQATDGRTTSTRQLSTAEARRLIESLVKESTTAAWQQSHQVAATMRRKLIATAHEMGWQQEGGKADMERINNWCCKYGYLKKALNEYRPNELPKLLTQFEQGPYKHFLNRI